MGSYEGYTGFYFCGIFFFFLQGEMSLFTGLRKEQIIRSDKLYDKQRLFLSLFHTCPFFLVTSPAIPELFQSYGFDEDVNIYLSPLAY